MNFEGIGDEVSVEGSIVQAAQALDFAGQFAQEARDTDRLLKIAEAWQNVADFIIELSEKEAKLDEKSKKDETPFGFHSKPDELVKADNDDEFEIEVEEDDDAGSTSNDPESDDDGTDASPSGDGVHPEYGQLRINENRRSGRRLRTRR